MFYSLDRFEGDLAVLVDDEGKQTDVPRVSLPAGVREGDVLTNGSRGAWLPAPDETARRKRRVQGLLDRLRGKAEE